MTTYKRSLWVPLWRFLVTVASLKWLLHIIVYYNSRTANMFVHNIESFTDGLA